MIEIYDMFQSGDVDAIVEIIRSWGIFAPLISIALMLLQAVIAPLPSFVITGANGIIFGVFWGFVVSWLGAMLGAAVTFYLSRIFGINFVRKYATEGKVLKKVDEISNNHGGKIILIGRLIPFVSFDFLSYASGLSTLKSSMFFLATGIGMIPGTLMFIIMGRQIMTWDKIWDWLILGLFVFFVVYLGIKGLIKRKNKNS